MTPIQNGTKIVQFPPISEAEASKIVKLADTMSEFMECDIHVVEVRVLAIEYDADRTDVGQILTKLAAAKKSKKGAL